ncbi:MAG: TolC family protein [Bacteroidota bacterium]
MKTKVSLLFLLISAGLMAQESLSLFECHQLAIENAPRQKDRELIQEIGNLKTDQAASNWYPSLDLNGKVSYQSDVVTITLANEDIPVKFPEVPHDQYGFNLDISQTIYDGGMIKHMKNYEQAAIAADIQQVEVDLYGLKGKVNQYFFAILALQENRKNLEVHMETLMARHEVVSLAIDQGAMLKSELKVIQVEVLKVRQSMLEVDSRKKSFLDALQVLCGEQIHEGVVLEHPRFEAVEGMETVRPEYRLFDLKNASMEAGKELIGRKRMPVLFAYGQTGYGKPGYNMMSGEWDFYYMLGAGLRWNIWDWNSSNRERQLIEQKQLILENQRSAFDRELEALRVQEEANIEQYKKSMMLEEEVLKLQEEISSDAALKLEHGTITATEYISELNKESISRINLAMHQVNLMKSYATYLNLLGNL